MHVPNPNTVPHTDFHSSVEYYDPHDIYKLLAPGLIPRLPLHHLHWQSHAGPLRSIDALHIDLVQSDDTSATTETTTPTPNAATTTSAKSTEDSTPRDDGFQTQSVTGQAAAPEPAPEDATTTTKPTVAQRRHQIPGLRRTPYLKVLLVRCDDNDSYKNSVRGEIREWLKANTPPSSSGSKKASKQENHDAFEWLIVHVVMPNTVAATQQRSTGKSEGSSEKSTASRWRPGTTPLLEKLRSDFNSSSKSSPDRVTQIRIGINQLPYDLLPRVVPAVPSGYSETEQDAERAWDDLVSKFKSLILTSFDQRVTQYEEDIKERDGQRTLPGWNFCTFFILKEGLARGFENVGLVEDALVGYDELNVGLDLVLAEQKDTDNPESHGGALLSYTDELRDVAKRALSEVTGNDEEEEAVDLTEQGKPAGNSDDIPISSVKKAYRDMILANKVSVFDFRCYIFSRQLSLLLRLANTSFTREQLLSRLKEQQDSILHGVAPRAKATPQKQDETEDLNILAEICKRSLEFIPAIANVMRQDLATSLLSKGDGKGVKRLSRGTEEVIDNLVASFAFSFTQQILAQTSTKSLPIPSSTFATEEGQEPKSMIPEPKTMMHPARNSSLNERTSRGPQSPPTFPGPGQVADKTDPSSQFFKAGLEDLAAGRAELYLMSRNILQNLGKKRGWSNGWDEAPLVGESGVEEMEEISLDDDDNASSKKQPKSGAREAVVSTAGVGSQVLCSAIDNSDDFYRLYEILTDKAMRHYTVANQDHAVETSVADLAVLKFHLKDYRTAAAYFFRTTLFFGKEGWSLLELSMLIMYAHCVKQDQSKEDFVYVALKLLTMSCVAEKASRIKSKHKVGVQSHLDFTPVKEFIAQLLESSKSIKADVKARMSSFFDGVKLTGPPTYEDGRDACHLTLAIQSLLPDDIAVDQVKVQASSSTNDGLSKDKDITFETSSEVTIKPGTNEVTLKCNVSQSSSSHIISDPSNICKSVIPGNYVVHNVTIRCGKVVLLYDKPAQSASSVDDFLQHREITIYQRINAFDAELVAAKHTVHDGSNGLDMRIMTGWNTIKHCKVRVKPGTGGLRLLTTDSKVTESSIEWAKPPESGLFVFNAIPRETTVTVQFPFTTETDIGDVVAKLEVEYTVESGETYLFAKSFTIPVSLVLGVNVQDVFKHHALFSRFNVSTSTNSPLRLFKSELLSTDLYESSFGAPPANPILVFPKQPAHLLYKVTRRDKFNNNKTASIKTAKTMRLKLHYRTLQDEVEQLICQSIKDALANMSSPLQPYTKHVLACVTAEIKARLQPQDLERAALLNTVTTALLDGVAWDKYFQGIGSQDLTSQLSDFVSTWQKSQPRLDLSTYSADPSSIVIPVEMPSVSIVHTADIRLQQPVASATSTSTTTTTTTTTSNNSNTPTVAVNQVLPATLHLKWTRMWDIDTSQRDDLEFSFEVSGPSDTWLVGGRRKGHFVIPGRVSADDQGAAISSSPETEAEIPLVLIPLRDGWLPYPMVEIREIKNSPSSLSAADQHAHVCEVDWRNLGETIRVIGDKSLVTVSLDASGPNGGPLVFESEQMASLSETRIVV